MFGRCNALLRATKTSRLRELLAGAAAVLLFGGIYAQAADMPVKAGDTTGLTTWGGLGWGIGVAADFDIGGARVVSASVVNNIVRVDDTSSNVKLGFVLEAHYFLTDFLFQSAMKNMMCSPPLMYCRTEVAVGPSLQSK